MSSQLVTFTLAGVRYGIAMLRVQEVLRGQPRTTVPLAEPSVAGVINLRGQVVLAIDLRTRLGLEPLAAGLEPLAAGLEPLAAGLEPLAAGHEPMMVIVQVDGEPISLLVDDVGDVIDVGGRQLEAPPDTIPTLLREVMLGVYQLEDHLLLVFDIERVMASEANLHPTPESTRRTP
jgi:purine-binding chemotaxis protein CheW